MYLTVSYAVGICLLNGVLPGSWSSNSSGEDNKAKKIYDI